MRRTATHLADGREIIYFDHPGAPARPQRDPRDLEPLKLTSELRHDPLLDEWVTMATHRQDRTHLPPADECPLCPSREGRQTEIPADDYDVVVFENRFPSLATTSGNPGKGSDLVPRRRGHGRCEVVCFTSDHDASFASLTPTAARLVVDAWVDRTAELSTLGGVQQVFCFENRGEEIGVTLSHPHGQIYAYPFVTPQTSTMLRSAHRYLERTGGNLFADVLAEEQSDGTRIVSVSEHWTAFVPAAARWPVEVHLYPHKQVPDLPALSAAEKDDLALTYLDLLARLDGLYDRPLPYVAAWYQAPVHTDRDLVHLHLRVFSIRRSADKLKYLAGSEAAMGAFITDVQPEDVAERLRKVTP